MSDTFTASNGVEIEIAPEGHLLMPPAAIGLGEESQQALREFFLHERDKELGRWRWPKSPNWVVYSNGGNDAVAIHEPDGLVFDITRWEGSRDHEALPDVAEAYFAAHQEPRPWHDAKPGEVWAVTDESGEHAYGVDPEQFYDFARDYAIDFRAEGITDARRIWPEVTP